MEVSHDHGIGTEQLRSAVGEAVRLTAELVAELDSDVESAFKRALAGGEGSPELNSLRTRVRQSIRRHRKDADRFRMVLFGRTGTGKSSLIEALSEGDGSSISTGVSDFTTEPRPVSWGPLELVDTPGVAGWGRTMSRAELEAAAADAVAGADLVLLTFDTLNQQSSEFDSAQRHIQRYGRPCIAVLNNKNSLWRDPSTPARQARRLQEQVEGSAQYIRAMMNQVGLDDVPVIAVNSQNAVAALASDDYRGPDAPLIAVRRAKRGIAALEDASNVQPLIELLTRTLENGAAQLRAQALRQDISGQVSLALEDMDSTVADLDRTHQVAIASLAETLSFIGAGIPQKKTARSGHWHRSTLGRTDWVAACRDDLDAAGIRISTAGELQRIMGQLLVIHLDGAIRELRSSGDQAVQTAVAAGSKVSGEQLVDDLRPAVGKLDASAKTCVDLLADAFADQLEGLELGFQLKLDLERLRESTFETKASRTGARAWAATEVLSAVVGAVAILASGPVGWTVAAGALVAGWFSGRKRKKSFERAESKDVRARAKIVDAIRSEINDVARSARCSVHNATEKMSTELATAVIPDLAKTIIETRDRRDVLVAEIHELHGLTADEPKLTGAQVIRASAKAVRDKAAGSHLDPLLGARPLEHMEFARAAEEMPVDLDDLVLDLDRRAAAAIAFLVTDTDPASADNKSNAPTARRRPVVGIVGRERVGARSLAKALQNEGKHGWSTRTVTQDGANASRCDLLIWLFAPNPTIDGHAAFGNLLGPDAMGRSDTLARSIFVIGKADTLAQDPMVDPHAYESLVDRKARELCDLLHTNGVDVSPTAVLSTMARPFGLSLRESPHFHPVSGIPHLASILTPQVARATARRRVRHEMIDRASDKLARTTARAEEASRQLSALDESIDLATAAVTDTKRLVAEYESAALTSVGDYVDGLALAVINAASAAELRPRLERLNSWPEHDRVSQIMTDWERGFADAQLRVSEALAEDLEAAARSHGLAGSDLGLTVGKERNKVGQYLGGAAKIVQGASKNRDAWYTMVKFLSRGKFKFKPWGAIKGARVVSKLGAVLAAVGVVVTVAELGFDTRSRNQRKKVREEVLQKSRADVTAVLAAYLWAEEERSDEGCGPLRFASDRAEALEREIAPLRKDRDVVARRFERAIADREAALKELNLNCGERA